MNPARQPHQNQHNPAIRRGVVFSSTTPQLAQRLAATLALLIALLASAHAHHAQAEVFITPQQLADRIDAEQQRLAQTKTADQPDTDTDTDAHAQSGDWHDAVRPLLIVHVGHGTGGYERGHIPGALYLEGRDAYAERDGLRSVLPTPGDLAHWLGEHGIGPGHDIVLYGDAAGIFPARVYAALATLGLDTHTRLLDGHLRRWALQGRPLSTNPAPQPQPIHFHPDPQVDPADTIATQTHATPIAPLVLDARSPKAFAGQTRVPGTDARGHLPRSANLPWRQLIPNIKDPALVPDADQRVLDAIHDAFRQQHPDAIADRIDFADPDQRARFQAQQPIQTLDDRGNGSAVLFAVLRHHGWTQTRWNPRGLPGHLQDGGTLTAPNE